MARFARIDSQIRANRLILANRFRVPKLNPLFCESRFEGLKIVNRTFKAKSGNLNLFLRILPFFSLISLYFTREKGQTAQKKI